MAAQVPTLYEENTFFATESAKKEAPEQIMGPFTKTNCL